MAGNTEAASRMCFSNAQIVTDRFRTVKLVLDSVKNLRIKLRWKTIDLESDAIYSKSKQKRFKPKEFENGDTIKQLFKRSRYILAKKEKNRIENQMLRAKILSHEFPAL